MKKETLYIFSGIALILLGFWLVFTSSSMWVTETSVMGDQNAELLPLPETETPEVPTPIVDGEEQGTLEPVERVPLPKAVLISDVPFIVQAPFGEWSDPIFQDACEEASLLMTVAWVQGEPLTRERARDAIRALAKYQTGIRGHAVDTSIDDTAALLGDYFQVATSEIHRSVTRDDIQQALAAGRVVVVPTDGRKLNNPNFTPPGPTRHMLVILGYDESTEEYIVNDPGTRRGEQYRYQMTVLESAVLDYPTGLHKEATSTDQVMLSVWRD